jgi:WD40 repeat protein
MSIRQIGSPSVFLNLISNGPVDSRINRFAWSPNGDHLASCSQSGTVLIWNADGRLHRTIKNAHTMSVRGLTWAPTGRTLASCSRDGTVKLWSLDGELQREFAPKCGAAHCIDWSSDGKTLAAGFSDGRIVVWDLPTDAERQTIPRHDGGVRALKLSPDGTTIASSSLRGTEIYLTDVTTGKLRSKFSGHKWEIHSIARSSDGQTLASGSNDLTICIWNIEMERLVIVLEGHTMTITDLSFSYDGRLLASISLDGTLRLWSCEVWAEIHRSGDLGASKSAISFHPHKLQLAFSTDNRSKGAFKAST